MSVEQDRLHRVLAEIGPLAVAVSGGVDSLTLAASAHRRLGRDRALMVHAASPAVPSEATRRVRSEAERLGWSLRVVPLPPRGPQWQIRELEKPAPQWSEFLTERAA